MPDRRGRRGVSDALLPNERREWAKAVWAERQQIAALPSGPWLLREAAKELGLKEEEVDRVLSDTGK